MLTQRCKDTEIPPGSEEPLVNRKTDHTTINSTRCQSASMLLYMHGKIHIQASFEAKSRVRLMGVNILMTRKIKQFPSSHLGQSSGAEDV